MGNYHQIGAVDYIMSFSRSGKPVKDLSRIKLLLEMLGNPQQTLKFVHIAGTNGKGSIAQMFNEIFINCGLKTGLFTSPYIFRYSDRIRVNSKNIDDSSLENLTSIVAKKIDTLPNKNDFSQFEITQAIAFLYFQQCKCDIVVLETGLGGLLDCTNVVETTVLTVIGSIGLDHTEVLGNSIEQIAFQKSGIIKQGVPCVLNAKNKKGVIDIIRKTADEKSAVLKIPDISLLKILSSDCFGSKFEYKREKYQLSLAGNHQIINALSVIDGVKLIDFQDKITYSNIFMGISLARLPARMQVISKEPLIILDGSHNEDGFCALANLIVNSGKKTCKLVIGMCKGKDVINAVKKILPYVDSFVTVDNFSERAIDKDNLAKIINNLGGRAEASMENIYNTILNVAKSNSQGINVICGSLFLASKFLNEVDGYKNN